MKTTVDPMVLGPLMIIGTTLWFGAMSWAGMHEDDTPRRPTQLPKAGDRGPWWTNEGFRDAPEVAPIPLAVERRDR